jgi:hypothetical protein
LVIIIFFIDYNNIIEFAVGASNDIVSKLNYVSAVFFDPNFSIFSIAAYNIFSS